MGCPLSRYFGGASRPSDVVPRQSRWATPTSPGNRKPPTDVNTRNSAQQALLAGSSRNTPEKPADRPLANAARRPPLPPLTNRTTTAAAVAAAARPGQEPARTSNPRRDSLEAFTVTDAPTGDNTGRARRPSLSTQLRQLITGSLSNLGARFKRMSHSGASVTSASDGGAQTTEVRALSAPHLPQVQESSSEFRQLEEKSQQQEEKSQQQLGQQKAQHLKPLALADRAVSIQLLELLVDYKVGNRKLGEMFTHEVVYQFIKPATANCKVCYIEALRSGNLKLPWTTVDANGDVRLAVSGHKAVAPSTYFVSHAWSYRFKDLVELVRQHATFSEHDPNALAYWLDIFAVSQNFTGKFENHIDGDFGSVIKASRGLLLTIHPFVQPKTPTRVWCLFEIINAVDQNKPMDLVLDPLFGKKRAYDTKKALTVFGSEFEDRVIKKLDVNNAEATVEADKTMILGLVRNRPGGVPYFNDILRKAMRAAVYDSLLGEAVYRGDVSSAEVFIGAGAKIRCNSVTPPPTALVGAAKVLSTALHSGSQVHEVHFHGSATPTSNPSMVLPAATSNAVKQLLDAIELSGIVTHLTLSKLNLSDIEAKAIARFVAKLNCPLQYLDISGNNFAEEGITALTHGLADNFSRTGRLTSIMVDMPRGTAGRDRDSLRASLIAANPNVTWGGPGTRPCGGGSVGGSLIDRASAGSVRSLSPAGRLTPPGSLAMPRGHGTLPPLATSAALRPTPPRLKTSRSNSGSKPGSPSSGRGGDGVPRNLGKVFASLGRPGSPLLSNSNGELSRTRSHR